MEYRKLEQTNIDVSVIALGCWPFAGGTVWGEQDDSVSIATVDAALAAGINFFDTAEGYENGHSERVLGRALYGRRSKAVIATKVSPNHLTHDEVIAACERSLVNLQTDYIDLYQIHWPNHEIPVDETVRALERLKDQGKIRAIGVSNFGVGDLTGLLAHTTCTSNQLPYNLLWRAIEAEIRPLCLARDVGIICYMPLAQGLLTGRYASADEVPPGLARARYFSSTRPLAKHGGPGYEAEVFAAVAAIRGIAAELGVSMAAVSLAWVRQQAGVTSLLVGARNPEEVGWNLPSLELTLSDDVLSALAATTEPIREKLGSDPDLWMVPSRYR